MSARPVHSICIPTYNRAALLRGAIANALSQTNRDIEVIVSDNASTDDTEAVVSSFQDARLKYYRNETNLGAQANFIRLVELASGDYMSWLQDDDLITASLSERAINALAAHPDCDAYAPYTLGSWSKTCMFNPAFFGPPFPIDWTATTPSVVPGLLFLPLSLLISTAMPPTMVFRRSAFDRVSPRTFDDDNYMYGERTLTASLVKESNVLIDPFIAGIFYGHQGQGSQANFSAENNRRGFAIMAKTLREMNDSAAADSPALLANYLPDYPSPHLLAFLAQAQSWPADNSFCTAVRDVIYAELCRRACTDAERVRAAKMYRPSKTRQLIRSLVPPIMFDILNHARN